MIDAHEFRVFDGQKRFARAGHAGQHSEWVDILAFERCVQGVDCPLGKLQSGFPQRACKILEQILFAGLIHKRNGTEGLGSAQEITERLIFSGVNALCLQSHFMDLFPEFGQLGIQGCKLGIRFSDLFPDRCELLFGFSSLFFKFVFLFLFLLLSYFKLL